VISEADLSVAVDLVAWFVRAGYPYPARPTLELGGEFPLVETWDDQREVLLVVACTADDNNLDDALRAAVIYAAWQAHKGRAPSGTIALAVGLKLWMNDEGTIQSIPVRQFLGGEV
jgi:hypothetical protein